MAKSKEANAQRAHDENAIVENRRGFLKMTGLGAVTGAGVLAAGSAKAETAVELNDERKGYQETAHVQQFYDLAKF